MRSSRPPLLATWMLHRLTRGLHSEAFQGDLLEAWREGRGNAWYWRQVLLAVALSLWRSSISLTRSVKLWSAVGAVGITVLIVFATPASVYFLMRVLTRVAAANHGKWWWPIVANGGMWMPWMIIAISSFAHRRRHRLPPS